MDLKKKEASETPEIIDFDYPDVYDHKEVEIRQSIAEINFKEITRNFLKFERNEKIDPVFVVQVHYKVDFFKFLIANLKNVVDVEKALLVMEVGIIALLLDRFEHWRISLTVIWICA